MEIYKQNVKNTKVIFNKNYEITKACIIGAGNVGWHLAQALNTKGITISNIYSRDISNATKLAKKLYDTQPTDQLNFSESKADLFIISVPDQVIDSVVSELILPSEKIILVHTSGSKSLSILENIHSYKGVFYPLQTFSKKKSVKFNKIPFFIEGQTPEITAILVKTASQLSTEVYEMGSQERKLMHIAAVFACNFTNHLLTISKDILSEGTGLDFEILKPLVKETLEKSLLLGSENSQTGPAIRKDKTVIKEHIEMLKGNPQYQEIYSKISERIGDYYK